MASSPKARKSRASYRREDLSHPTSDFDTSGFLPFLAPLCKETAEKVMEEATMIDSEQWMDIKELHRQGLSQMLNGVTKILGQSTPQPFKKAERSSALVLFKPYLQGCPRLVMRVEWPRVSDRG
jgi:hypothetical protein